MSVKLDQTTFINISSGHDKKKDVEVDVCQNKDVRESEYAM